MDKERESCGYLRQKFPTTSEAKMKEVIFVGPHSTQPFEDQDFSTELNSAESRAWKVFENVCRIFTGSEKAGHYSEIMQKLISSYSAVGCNVLLKLHFFITIYIFLTENMGAILDEHGERFDKEISQIVKRYSAKWSPNLLADCCWSLIWEKPTGRNKRQKKIK
jgi:hypothetical protein